MGTILLAIEGIQPKPEVINYALDLSRELGAGLDILEILPSCTENRTGSTPLGKALPSGEITPEAKPPAQSSERQSPETQPPEAHPPAGKNRSALLPGRRKSTIRTLKRGLQIVQTILQESMCAVSFAEAGEDRIARQIVEQALNNLSPYLAKGKPSKTQPNLYLRRGKPAEEVIHFVQRQKKIIFTIFNPQKKEDRIISELQKGLPVPLVLVAPRKN